MLWFVQRTVAMPDLAVVFVHLRGRAPPVRSVRDLIYLESRQQLYFFGLPGCRSTGP